MNKRLLSIPIVTLLILSVVLVSLVPRQTQGAYLNITSSISGGLDEYGQGFQTIFVKQYNGVDGWRQLTNPLLGWQGELVTINATYPVCFQMYCVINNTLIGASSVAEGKNYLRHSILIYSPLNASVFFQQNATYVSGAFDGDMIEYAYNFTIDFNPQYSTTYTAIITMDVFY